LEGPAVAAPCNVMASSKGSVLYVVLTMMHNMRIFIDSIEGTERIHTRLRIARHQRPMQGLCWAGRRSNLALSALSPAFSAAFLFHIFVRGGVNKDLSGDGKVSDTVLLLQFLSC
jgi:hypothetical protein